MSHSPALPPLDALILLSTLEGMGPATYWKLLEAFGSPQAVIAASVKHLEAVCSKPLATQICALGHQPVSEAEAVLAWCEQNGIALVAYFDPRYPPCLREINCPPPLLYVHGNPAVLNAPQVAVVGSRNSSRAGRHHAFDMAAGLAREGYTITSGLALGIDAQAHLGALAAKATTIAVIGSGIDHIYPKANQPLARDIIASGGCIVSEFPLGTTPQAKNFPRRNRIISGLSLGTLVVEAAIKSGSLITARYAVEQNREVFAMPSSVHSPLSRGCHALIREGATLVESTADILREIRHIRPLPCPVRVSSAVAEQSHCPVQLTLEDRELLRWLEYSPQTLEQLAEASALPVAQLLSSLMSLELCGVVANEEGGYALVRPCEKP